MRNVTLENITGAVVGALSQDVPSRQREIMTSLIKHMHDFCRDVNLQSDEFLQACDYMARAGAICDDQRQEFILLADILGIEVLVDMLSNETTGDESESTVLGPFYRENPPVLPAGASIVQMDFDGQETVLIEGIIRDASGAPISGVMMDVWEDAPNGLYEQQDPEQPDFNLRGRFETDESGRYSFRAIRPVPYPIPEDGTAGELLSFMGHHPWRPGHIHFMLFKSGYRTLVSQIFDGKSEYLDNDSVFAVKESLIGEFKKAPSNVDADLVLEFDFVLKSQDS
ncbi:MAG: intradiol ring-cleavage dioxygenase [Alphaproteobacteria bacterium]|nr:intradiol ring-cleavage dioxygenase [Alphaproteobacteria bacterium]